MAKVAPVASGSRMSLRYAVSWHVFRVLFSTWFRWRVYHPERVPAAGPVILAANHASYLDPMLVGAGIRRQVNYLARDTLFPVPVVGTLLRYWKVVPVDREGGGAAGLRTVLTRLAEGGVILMFPEGTRTHDGQLQPPRLGIGLVVIKSTAPVVPVRVFGTYEAFGRHLRWPRRHPLAVLYGRPLAFTELRTEAKKSPQAELKGIYREIAQDIMAAIAGLEPVESPASKQAENG
jgi:1-acyl-sn-glycerol-3-phosphate acyltransferase